MGRKPERRWILWCPPSTLGSPSFKSSSLLETVSQNLIFFFFLIFKFDCFNFWFLFVHAHPCLLWILVVWQLTVYPASSVTDLSAVDASLKAMELQIQAIKDRVREETLAIPKAKVPTLSQFSFSIYICDFFSFFFFPLFTRWIRICLNGEEMN